MTRLERLKRLEPGEIETDRQLLERLGLNDAQAAMYLGKSRQALNNKLGSKRAGDSPNDYFKPSDILVLVLAAKQSGRPFDEAAIRSYITATRKPTGNANRKPYELLMELLGASPPMTLEDVAAVVLILPDFADLCSEHPEAAKHLQEVASQIRSLESNPWVVVLSSTPLRATSAAQWLNLTGDRSRALCHDFVDHYVPLVLIYEEGKEDPRPFMLTDQGTLVAAPQYRAPTMAMCVRAMVPPEVSSVIFPKDSGDGPGSRATPRKQEAGQPRRQRTRS